MVRSALFSAGLGGVIAWNWARLEHPHPGLGSLALMVGFGIAPALLPATRWRIAGALAAVVAAASIALHAHPYDIGLLAGRAGQGFVDFYDVVVPFDGAAHSLMDGVVLLAVCLFSLACALAVATRRPLGASLALVAGAGWPATIFPAGDDLRRGAVLLVASLALVAWLRPQPRRLPPQVLAGTGLVLLALILSSSSAVAKGQFLAWQNWNFDNKPAKPLSVDYIWRASYDGIHFPRKRTRVFTVRASAHSAYWRATTLDAFWNDRWDEDLITVAKSDLLSDPLLPAAGRNRANWTAADVTIDALRDIHLLSTAEPVDYDTHSLGPVQYARGGIAYTQNPASRGDGYTVYGYLPRPTPAQLARSRPDYPPEIAHGGLYLAIGRGRHFPTFGVSGREALAATYFDAYPSFRRYRPLYQVARRVVGGARNPYAATIALEAWFRSGGGFIYDETPPRAQGEPPLVAFVTRTKRGYCQHFAGAMALALRFLGIPARVAAGFTSGTYDGRDGTWTVYDRNAHTWVEVWFEGYGWLPFDPTPSRGNLGGPYTASSLSFDAPGAVKVLAASAIAARRLLRFELGPTGVAGRGGAGRRGLGDVKSARGGGHSAKGFGTGGIAVLAALGLAILFALGKLTLRRSRFLTRDPRRLATACRRELVDYLLDQRVDVQPSTPLGELRTLFRNRTGVDPRAVIEALGLARFGPVSSAARAARDARRELRRVRGRLRRALPLGARVRGLFSLRSVLVR
jgi:transglutaminase-like putative cysteine protease